MSRNLIVTMACGGASRIYGEFTFPLIEKYAQRCDADFHAVFTVSPKYPHISYQKWDYVEFLDHYDRVLHIDADMVIMPDAPNLFDVVGPEQFAGVNEYPYQDLSIEIPAHDRYEDLQKLGPAKPSFYINAGMYLFARNHRDLFDKPNWANGCYFKEQSHINYNLNTRKVDVCLLDINFNYMSIMELKGLPKNAAHIIHYAGGWRGLSHDLILKMMKDDYAAAVAAIEAAKAPPPPEPPKTISLDWNRVVDRTPPEN